ncbi:MAG TPA: DUF2490 domain-containing protein [Bacteroidia bacterium]|nr:DUF2490 domain-containing protein [Bacteroidia bacterium]
MKRPGLFLFLSFLLCRPLFAQHQDLGSWMTFSANKGLFGKLEFNFDQEFRLRDNLTNVNLFYTNLGFSYKVNKYMKVSATYRFIDKHKSDGSYGLRNRFFTDLTFKIKPGKFNLSYRFRCQEEWRGAGYNDTYGNVPEIYIRNLFKVAYKLTGHWSPYAGTELRWQLQNPRIPYYNGFDRSRFFAGTDYKINDHNTAGVYFLYQLEWNVVDPETLYIIGLEYSIDID